MAWVKMGYKTDFSKSNLAWESLKFCTLRYCCNTKFPQEIAFFHLGKVFLSCYSINLGSKYTVILDTAPFMNQVSFFFLNASSPATKFRRINTYPDTSVSIPPSFMFCRRKSVNNCPDSLEVSTILNEEYKI